MHWAESATDVNFGCASWRICARQEREERLAREKATRQALDAQSAVVMERLKAMKRPSGASPDSANILSVLEIMQQWLPSVRVQRRALELVTAIGERSPTLITAEEVARAAFRALEAHPRDTELQSTGLTVILHAIGRWPLHAGWPELKSWRMELPASTYWYSDRPAFFTRDQQLVISNFIALAVDAGVLSVIQAALWTHQPVFKESPRLRVLLDQGSDYEGSSDDDAGQFIVSFGDTCYWDADASKSARRERCATMRAEEQKRFYTGVQVARLCDIQVECIRILFKVVINTYNDTPGPSRWDVTSLLHTLFRSNVVETVASSLENFMGLMDIPEATDLFEDLELVNLISEGCRIIYLLSECAYQAEPLSSDGAPLHRWVTLIDTQGGVVAAIKALDFSVKWPWCCDTKHLVEAAIDALVAATEYTSSESRRAVIYL